MSNDKSGQIHTTAFTSVYRPDYQQEIYTEASEFGLEDWLALVERLDRKTSVHIVNVDGLTEQDVEPGVDDSRKDQP